MCSRRSPEPFVPDSAARPCDDDSKTIVNHSPVPTFSFMRRNQGQEPVFSLTQELEPLAVRKLSER